MFKLNWEALNVSQLVILFRFDWRLAAAFPGSEALLLDESFLLTITETLLELETFVTHIYLMVGRVKRELKDLPGSDKEFAAGVKHLDA